MDIEIKERLEKETADILALRNELSKRGVDTGYRNSVSIEQRNLNDLYFYTVRAAFKHGEMNPVENGSHAGEIRLEFPNYMGCITNPTERPLAPIINEGIPTTTDENAIHNYFNDYLLDGALHPNEHYRYSCWITGIPEFYTAKQAEEIGLKPEESRIISLTEKDIPRGTRFNQLEWCLNHFVEKGFGTNHCAITVGCAEGLQRYDWPWKEEFERGSTECLRQIKMKIRKGNQLDLTTDWRSWDLFEGFPENLGGMVHLMEYSCNFINSIKKDSQPEVVPGRLYATSDGLHIYSHSVDASKLLMNWN